MNPPDQLSLDFTAPHDSAALEIEARLGELLAVLKGHGGWMTARDLKERGFGDRELRVLSEFDHEARIFSYPGSPGYKHFDLVTDEEFDRCVALRSQGEKMVAKYARYQCRWHRRGKVV